MHPEHTGSVRFRSRIDAWLVVLIVLSLTIAPLVLLFGDSPNARGSRSVATAIVIVTSGLTTALIAWIFATTDYTVTNTHIVVRSGPMNWRVPLADVRSIRPTNSILSAPALSIHRVEITYGRYGSLVISPADPAAFVAAVRARVPGLIADGIASQPS